MSEFLTLVTVAVLAFLAPGLSKRLKMPVVVGEIALGMLVGVGAFVMRHLGYATLPTGEGIAFLAEIGFILLLFLAGLEIDFNTLEDRGPLPIIIGLGVFAATLGIAYLVTSRLGYGFFGALVLSTTSVGIVVPTLREAGLTRTGFGQNIIVTSLIADFGTMLLLTIYVFVLERGAPGETAVSWVPFLLIPLFFVIFYAVYRLGGLIMWHRPHLLTRFFKSQDPTEGGVRASLALMFAFVALSAALGVEAILGAFLAGTMISLLFREGALLEEKLYGIGYGFFVPLFFIHLGLTFDYASVADKAVLLLLPALLVLAFGIKMIPALLWSVRYGARRVVAIGALTASRLTLMIAAASIGLRLGVIDPSLYAAVIVLALVSSALGPVLFRILMKSQPRSTTPPANRASAFGAPAIASGAGAASAPPDTGVPATPAPDQALPGTAPSGAGPAASSTKSPAPEGVDTANEGTGADATDDHTPANSKEQQKDD